MGEFAGKCIAAELRGRAAPGSHRAFTYFDKGTMATVGRGKAVLESKWLRLSGFPAWVVWALVHIVFLVGFRSRIAAMWGWLWAYLLFSANNEIITKPLTRDEEAD